MGGATISIDLTDITKLREDLGPNLLPLVMARAGLTMALTLQYVTNQVAGRTPVNSGALRSSITSSMKKTGTKITGTVMTPMTYGPPVEFGRRADGRWPPRGAIEMWMVRKGIAENIKEAKRTSFPIRRAIGTGTSKGIMRPPPKGGAKMFSEGFDASLPYLEKKWGSLLDDLMMELGRES